MSKGIGQTSQYTESRGNDVGLFGDAYNQAHIQAIVKLWNILQTDSL